MKVDRVRYLKVQIRGENTEFEVAPDPSTNLRVALLKHKQKLYKGIHKLANCRGKGICGSCMVRVVDNPGGLTDKTPSEAKRLWAASPQTRLACQAFICGDIEVDLAKFDVRHEAEQQEEAKDARAAIEAMKAAAE